VDVFGELRKIMLVVEEAGKRNLGADVGLWIERLISEERGPTIPGLFGGGAGMMDPMMRGPMGAYPPGMAGEFDGGGMPPTAAPGMDPYAAGAPGMMGQPPADPYGMGAPNPYGGAPVDPYGGAMNPAGAGAIDPMTGQPMIDPNTGMPMGAGAGGGMEPVIDPNTGQPMIDPMTGMPMMQPAAGGTAAPPGSKITLLCKAISLSAVNPTANTDIAFALEKALKNSELFDPQGTSLQGQINVDEDKGIFTFGVTLVLKHPLEF
jgi:hypothetical protein